MLTKCPECDLQVSDKAVTCPHCGYPLIKRPAVRNNPSKHRRLPNGFGQITELKNPNLRNRFRVMVSVGKKENGRPISKLLKPQAYFETYNEAYKALVEYNKNPYDLNDAITVQELYDRWSADYYPKATSGGIRTHKAAWAYCSTIYNMRVADVRARHIKGCIDDGTAVVKGITKHASAGVKTKIKSLFNLMLDYAVEYEIVEKNYARTFTVSDDVMKEIEDSRQLHIPFSDDEMEILWKNINKVPYVDMVLYQCYSGWRPQELGLLVLTNVNLDEEIIIGGMKTSAGTLRKVPIHPKMKEIVEKRYKEAEEHGSPYLFNCFDEHVYSTKGYKMNYMRYRQRFIEVIEKLGLNPEHKPHDPRKHFITQAKKYKMDEYALKRIVGHDIDDITEAVYTDRPNSWLLEEMKKIIE